MEYVERELEKEILRYMKIKEILAVVGARQCGKTTMINKILDNLEKKGKKIARISFDNQKILKLFEEDIDSFIDQYVRKFDILFIDEVHYSKDSGKKLKYIYDSHSIKILITGSSVSEVSIHSLKYLVGRIFIFELYPFSFKEFLRFKDIKMLGLFESGIYKKVTIDSFNKYLKEYLIYGGYPKVVLSKEKEEKIKILENILSTYLLKEIREILDLSENYNLINLIKALSLQTGNIINYNELSKITKFSYYDLRKYLNVLEKTYVCSFVRPYFTNKRTELTKNPKVYFIDNGFRNISMGNFNEERTDIGQMHENFIFTELKIIGKNPNFWNTKSKAEVDFIIEKNGKIIPIEIKSNVHEMKISKSFASFIKKYNPHNSYYLSLDFEGKRKFDNCLVEFLPFVKFVGKIKGI